MAENIKNWERPALVVVLVVAGLVFGLTLGRYNFPNTKPFKTRVAEVINLPVPSSGVVDDETFLATASNLMKGERERANEEGRLEARKNVAIVAGLPKEAAESRESLAAALRKRFADDIAAKDEAADQLRKIYEDDLYEMLSGNKFIDPREKDDCGTQMILLRFRRSVGRLILVAEGTDGVLEGCGEDNWCYALKGAAPLASAQICAGGEQHAEAQ